MKEEQSGKFFPIARLFPNLITLLGLCAGLTSIKFTFIGKWESAIVFIIIAAVIDGMDGRIARLLNSTSGFGAQLDSFADFLNFGAAPAFLLYFWSLRQIKVIGWMLVMTFVICMSIRLARFNMSLYEEEKELDWHKFFFVGVPAPLGAILSLIPIMLTFYFHDNHWLVENLLEHNKIAVYFAIIAFLSVSNIPTFSAKHLYIPKNLIYIFIVLLGIFIVFAITKPWLTFPVVGIMYILSIPVSSIVYIYLMYKNKNKKNI
ncbi:CDP-alcohol phosphatidyltransferase family protein [Ehrlichia ruminantium]|uniref:CDP-diacylglycerol--serine O-phosphatidyltransferase n=2 Tax=Ehrlichia ruminantium TaxID=779 RepID=A0A0H3M830_EHRRW|nr:phosphatidylcholine/phosphatidylserine synthase [Ehrlichia ruminantium]QLK54989.1 phosphatidylcholine/phosphatidylserine synthase [Ehrlichia ruminantium]QLK55907.1 phosphatidylcholine/phosphatidylserine synthase [Ehrlichia ruminantium]UOE00010.1 phosphatidylcholine/phosphatidylserine synthase [Ehrlichia ruminantium]CAH58033.1 putative CDP-diacylglycerol--serine O-phosphatidyltransferase [Ehrlichia ruminantium str. Welgevonden]CAI26815.1 CDP-diacylglycerol--serine O-phosphatidyltransferase [